MKEVIYIQKSKIETITNLETGEISRKITTDLDHNRTSTMKDGHWRKENQRKDERMKNAMKDMYTVKGRIWEHLKDIMDFGGFCLFNGSNIARACNTSRQQVSKYKKELINDGLMVEAINKVSLQKGVLLNPLVVEKGGVNDDIITLEQWENEQKNDDLESNRFSDQK